MRETYSKTNNHHLTTIKVREKPIVIGFHGLFLSYITQLQDAETLRLHEVVAEIVS